MSFNFFELTEHPHGKSPINTKNLTSGPENKKGVEEISMNVLTWFHENSSLPAIIALVGAIISASGAFWASYEQVKSKKVAEARTQENVRLNQKILALTEENKELAKRGIDYITGGNGYVYVDIVKGTLPNAFAPIVISKSEFPQYDLSIRFFDDQKDQQAQIFHPIILNIATLPPGQDAIFQTPAFELPAGKDVAKFNLFISARNGSFIEEVQLRKVEGEWWSAVRLTKEENNTKAVLLERAQDQYPRTPDGKIDWK